MPSLRWSSSAYMPGQVFVFASLCSCHLAVTHVQIILLLASLPTTLVFPPDTFGILYPLYPFAVFFVTTACVECLNGADRYILQVFAIVAALKIALTPSEITA